MGFIKENLVQFKRQEDRVSKEVFFRKLKFELFQRINFFVREMREEGLGREEQYWGGGMVYVKVLG